MTNEPSSTPFKPGALLDGYFSRAIVLEVHEVSAVATLLLLPSGFRVVAKFWQIDAWQVAEPLSEGWRVEKLAENSENPDWSVYLPDEESAAALMNDRLWHGGEAPYVYRVSAPATATDEEMVEVEDRGGIL